MEPLSQQQSSALLKTLQIRFDQNMNRHENLKWNDVQTRLEAQPVKLFSLFKMEESEGEPDVVDFDEQSDEFIFFDCAKETPKARRSCCYDDEALQARKENKPKFSAVELAAEISIALLTEEQYRYLQSIGTFDTKTSSWIATPKEMRQLGGALFGDFRYGRTFFYHNGAESYYSSRGFRGALRV